MILYYTTLIENSEAGHAKRAAWPSQCRILTLMTVILTFTTNYCYCCELNFHTVNLWMIALTSSVIVETSAFISFILLQPCTLLFTNELIDAKR